MSLQPTNQLAPLTFPLHGSRLIEASAGTGKTWTIAALYVRLVLGHGGENGYRRPLLPADILVMTFTRAAMAQHQPHVQRGDGPGLAGAGAGLDQARAVQRERQRRQLIGDLRLVRAH